MGYSEKTTIVELNQGSKLDINKLFEFFIFPEHLLPYLFKLISLIISLLVVVSYQTKCLLVCLDMKDAL